VKNFSESIHDICENFNIKIDGRKKIFMKTCSPNEKISTMDASEKRTDFLLKIIFVSSRLNLSDQIEIYRKGDML